MSTKASGGKSKYPRITITFLPNKILVNIEKWEKLSIRKIQKSFRDIHREYDVLRKKAIKEDLIKTREEERKKEKEDGG